VATALDPSPELVAAHTSTTRKEPYIQAFWKKEK
jgi:hypothetical protein